MPTSSNLRVHVIGTSGAGKSTVAKHLASELGMPRLELDSIYHQANWTPLPVEDFRSQVAEFIKYESWVIDGNYSTVSDLIDERATHVVWLDYPRWFVMLRLLRRTLKRTVMRQELWNGNRETLSNLFSRDPHENILLWAWTTHNERRLRFTEILEGDAGTVKIRIGSPFLVNRLLMDSFA
jgi:adenylate kinase family enzyme